MTGGLLGSLFIRINNSVNLFRKKILTSNFRKIIEGLTLTFITVSVMYLTISGNYWIASSPSNGGIDNYRNNTNFCEFKNSTLKDVPTREFLCEHMNGQETFDRLATLLFESQASTIKTFMSD